MLLAASWYTERAFCASPAKVEAHNGVGFLQCLGCGIGANVYGIVLIRIRQRHAH